MLGGVPGVDYVVKEVTHSREVCEMGRGNVEEGLVVLVRGV